MSLRALIETGVHPDEHSIIVTPTDALKESDSFYCEGFERVGLCNANTIYCPEFHLTNTSFSQTKSSDILHLRTLYVYYYNNDSYIRVADNNEFHFYCHKGVYFEVTHLHITGVPEFHSSFATDRLCWKLLNGEKWLGIVKNGNFKYLKANKDGAADKYLKYDDGNGLVKRSTPV